MVIWQPLSAFTHLQNSQLTQIDPSMKHLPNFPLVRPAKLSSWFIDQGITDFSGATAHLRTLPYRRTSESGDLSAVLNRSGGSFTARNALLVQLSREQSFNDLSLALCMHAFDQNCPGVNDILSERGLECLPDAQGCIQYQGQMFTVADDSLCLETEVLSEIDIAPAQINTFKRRYHQNYLSNWMQLERLDRAWSVEALWEVRSQCLRAVAQQWDHCLRSVS